jgi:signal transduction histidine kinase
MSERLKAEVIAKNERKRLNDALELLPAYLILLTPDYHVPYANRFFRERFGESGGKRCFEYLFGRTEPCEVCDTYRTLKENKMVTWEWVGPDKHIYSIFDYPFKDTDGSPMIMEVGIDVTELKEAQHNLLSLNKELELRVAELLRSNMELEQFAQVASHDLQEPLRMVASYTQLLSKKYSGKLDDNANDYIKFAVEGATRMQNLIIGLLDISRIEMKGGPVIKVDMNNALKNALNNLKITIGESHATITSDDLPSVMADEGQIVRLFQNLVSNAIKFSEKPPVIKVLSVQSNGNHIFSVSDNGIGIEEQYFEKIFRIFQRLMPRDKYDGTGIGLSICKKIVERHGGKIWVESEPGIGSTFRFSLPATTGPH